MPSPALHARRVRRRSPYPERTNTANDELPVGESESSKSVIIICARPSNIVGFDQTLERSDQSAVRSRSMQAPVRQKPRIDPTYLVRSDEDRRALSIHDVRFPTSRSLDGSDAMHTSPDYSAAYVVSRTTDDELSGHGLTFTNGRGTEICVAAIHALEPLVVGRTLEGITGDMRGFWRSLVSDNQLRWLGPEKGVIHLAAGAVVNAVWDLWAKDRESHSGSCSPTSPPRSSSRRSTSATSTTSSRPMRRSTSSARRRAERPSESADHHRRVSRRTRRRPDGSVTTTRRWPPSFAARSPTDSATSR